LPYDELDGCVANAAQEALVQDYDDVLRIAPAWPSASWDVSGTEYIHGKRLVHVQIAAGKLVTVVVEAGSTGDILLRNPWGTQTSGSSTATARDVVAATVAAQITIPPRRVARTWSSRSRCQCIAAAGAGDRIANAAPRGLGPVTIGVR